jgi:hypothetical protein
MNNKRRKLSFAPLHFFYNWRDLHEVGPRADNINYFEHSNWSVSGDWLVPKV